MSQYDVQLINENMHEFYIKFEGPTESIFYSDNSLINFLAPYKDGIWKVHVELPSQYPYKSPSIGFMNRIFHPNIDEVSGSVCLDVINQSWSPMFDLINVFEVFMPQLLRYPNPSDPLNGEAAALLMRDPKSYEVKVVEYVKKYASGNGGEDKNGKLMEGEEGKDDDDEEEEVAYYSDDEDQADRMEL